jgi:hypothetical protein
MHLNDGSYSQAKMVGDENLTMMMHGKVDNVDSKGGILRLISLR